MDVPKNVEKFWKITNPSEILWKYLKELQVLNVLNLHFVET